MVPVGWGREEDKGMKLITHLELVPRSRKPKKRLMITYHWISLFKSYIQSAN
jgi:hypothetical protein